MTSMVQELVVSAVAVVLTAVGATRRERVRWRRSTAAADAERALVAKRALRLVERELFEAQDRIARAVQAGHFAPDNRRLTTSDWEQHRGTVATELGVADWHLVTAAYDAINDLNQRLTLWLSARTPQDTGQAIADGLTDAVLSRVRDDDKLQLRWRAIRTSAWILRAYLDEAEKVEFALAEDERISSQLWPRDTSQRQALPLS